VPEKEKNKKTLTSTKVICAKCGKEHFVNFVADGHRDYYCDSCLKEMHHDRKKGKIKKVISRKTGKPSYEFVCDICDNFRRASYYPATINGLFYCKECENRKKAEDLKKKRKRIVIASEKKES